MYEHLKDLDINAIRRQPKNQNYLQLNEFRFVLHRTPKMVYFCQEVYFPGITVPTITQPSPFGTPIQRSSNKVEYENLDLTFLVNEDMENWKEIRYWIEGLTTEKDYEKPLPEKERFSDATLVLMTNASNPFFYITFNNCFPVSLSGIQFSSTVEDIQPAKASMRFGFSGYSIRHIKDF
jgi:hypothetical protein